MITNITLQNFKCFRELEVNPKLITVFIGPNGTGKSSVLQALLLLKQSEDLNKGINLQGRLVQFASEDLEFHSHDQPPVVISLSGYWSSASSRFEYRWECLLLDRNSQLIDQPPSIFVGEDSFLIIMRGMRFVPALRGLTQADYSLLGDFKGDIRVGGDFATQEQETVAALVYSRLVRINDSMKQITGVGFATHQTPGPERLISLVGIGPSGGVHITSEGFGTNSLLQLLLELERTEYGDTVLIEEPEIHLHPKAQAELASVIATEAKRNNKQVIMTTHSEHLLSRLLTLVAEKRLSPDQLVIYSFEKDSAGECSASEIEVTERGQVTGGLTGFFDANLAEMDRYVKALQTKS